MVSSPPMHWWWCFCSVLHRENSSHTNRSHRALRTILSHRVHYIWHFCFVLNATLRTAAQEHSGLIIFERRQKWLCHTCPKLCRSNRRRKDKQQHTSQTRNVRIWFQGEPPLWQPNILSVMPNKCSQPIFQSDPEYLARYFSKKNDWWI